MPTAYCLLLPGSAAQCRLYGRGESDKEIVDIFKGKAEECPDREVVETHKAVQMPASAPRIVPGAGARQLAECPPRNVLHRHEAKAVDDSADEKEPWPDRIVQRLEQEDD